MQTKNTGSDTLIGMNIFLTNFVKKLKSRRSLLILLFSFISSITTVSICLNLRWEGSRTGPDAFIPLRPLTAKEAVVLLNYKGRPDLKLKPSTDLEFHKKLFAEVLNDRNPGSAIVSEENGFLYIVTAYYLITVDSGEAYDSVDYKGTKYRFIRSSWESYYNKHRLKKTDLENELQGPIPTAWFNPSYLNKKISFKSYFLWQYFAFEVFYIGFVIFIILFFFLNFQKKYSPVLWAILLILHFVLVPLYAPAFFDADNFFQRIAFEYFTDLLILCSMILVLMTFLGVFWLGADLLVKLKNLIMVSKRSGNSERIESKEDKDLGKNN